MENGHIQITFKYHGECTNTIIQVSVNIQRCVHPHSPKYIPKHGIIIKIKHQFMLCLFHFKMFLNIKYFQ